MRAWVVHNPAAGPRYGRCTLDEALSVLTERGWSVKLHTGEHAADVADLARNAVASGCDALIVAGGDGSVREAAAGLAGSPVALGVLPCGTANVWAQEIGLPLPHPFGSGLVEAARALAQSEIRQVDLGRANGHYFLLWAGIGLDAHVAAQVNPSELKRALGVPGYAFAALIAAPSFRGVQLRLTGDGWAIEERALLAVISNVQLYAGGIVRLDDRAQVDDGLFEVWAFRGEDLRHGLDHLLRIWTGRHRHAPGVWYRRSRHIRVETDPSAPVHLDGDPLLQTPIEIEVMPGALRALVPRPAAMRLFGHP